MKVKARNLGLGLVRHKSTDNNWVPVVGLFHNTRIKEPEVLVTVAMRGVVTAFLVPDLEEIEYDPYK